MSEQFTRLYELQQDNYSTRSSEREKIFMDEVNLEFLTKLATNIEDGTEINSVSISKLTRAGNFIQEVLL